MGMKLSLSYQGNNIG